MPLDGLCLRATHTLALARLIASTRSGGKHAARGAVIDLAWGTGTKDTLVALIEPAILVFVNGSSGAVLRSYALAQGALLSGLSVNVWDGASLALTSMSATLVLAHVETPTGHVLGRQISLPFAGAMQPMLACEYVPALLPPLLRASHRSNYTSSCSCSLHLCIL